MNKYSIFLVLLVLSLTGITSWLKAWLQPGSIQQNRSDEKAAYYLKNFIIHDMREDGQLRFRLNGQLLNYLPEKDGVEILKPHIQFLENTTDTWQILSEKAFAKESLGEIDFIGEVIMQRPASATWVALTINTRDLRVNPAEKTAVTQEKTIITSANSTLIAKEGLSANLKNHIITLHHVEGRYATEN